jgi:predicted anti-sigma-YlaC factor YlaD
MGCKIFREMLDSYLDESMDEERRRWFRGHLRECSSCRDWALSRDPSLLFAVANAAAADPARVDACATVVTAQIRQQRVSRRLHHRRRPWLAAAAAMVVAVSGALAWRAILNDGGAQGPTEIEAQMEIDAVTTPPTVEVEMAGDDVRVYQFATDDDNDTAVYFVVDPAMEL